MKRSTIFIGMLLSAASVMAQTETAKTLYKEATADRSKMEQYVIVFYLSGTRFLQSVRNNLFFLTQKRQ